CGIGEPVYADILPPETTAGRPAFHFTTRRGWINDPNGLYFDGRLYHLFYQHNPVGPEWGNMHWGHATSDDLLHWNETDDILYPDERGTMYSGSAITDEKRASGLGGGAAPTLLYYTSAGGNSELSADQPFTQCLAYGDGIRFEKYDKNPVIEHIAGANRDPKVIWCEELDRYVLALYLEGNDYGLFTSNDLLSWTQLNRITLPGDSECPDFYPLTAPDGERRWILSGASDRYLIGRVTRENGFTAEGEALPYRWGRTFSYAAQSYSGLCSRIRFTWEQAIFEGKPWRSQMSVPCEMTLASVSSGYRLCSNPIKALETLRGEKYQLDALPPSPLDILFTISANTRDFSVSAHGTPIVFSPQNNKIITPDGEMPLTISGGSRTSVRILIDTASYELFADDGLVFTAGQLDTSRADVRIDGNVIGTAYEMRSV
ncbi:MAG: glycoside hydrolase family 32 protein, partial [Eubacteriales bacterium]